MRGAAQRRGGRRRPRRSRDRSPGGAREERGRPRRYRTWSSWREGATAGKGRRGGRARRLSHCPLSLFAAPFRRGRQLRMSRAPPPGPHFIGRAARGPAHLTPFPPAPIGSRVSAPAQSEAEGQGCGTGERLLPASGTPADWCSLTQEKEGAGAGRADWPLLCRPGNRRAQLRVGGQRKVTPPTSPLPLRTLGGSGPAPPEALRNGT